MYTDGAVRRQLPAIASVVVVAAAAWRIAGSSLPGGALAGVAALLCLALVVSALTFRLRRGRRIGTSGLVLIEGLSGIVLATAALMVSARWLANPVPLTTLGFVAVLLTVNPAARVAVLSTVLAAAAGGIAVVWWWSGLLTHRGAAELVQVEAMVGGIVVLAYSKWSFTDAHSRRQTHRLRAVADIARRLGVTLDLRDVADAVLSGCHDFYPDATWGGVLLFEPESGRLASLPVYLGPAGVTTAGGAGGVIIPGEGVTGRVYSSGEPSLLRTPDEVAAAYAGTGEERMAWLERNGGGRAIRSSVAVPLHAPDGRVIGVLALNSHSRGRVWTADDLVAIQAIADETALAVERTRLFDEQARSNATDPLTQVGNRRAFENQLATDTGGGCAVIAIDVDDLKAVNDEHGHEAGDVLLVEVARTLRAHLRSADTLVRTGGDEFVAILPATSEVEAAAIADRMRGSLHGVALPNGMARISAGVAGGGPGADLRVLWSAADDALSSAKRTGRDRVRVAGSAARPGVGGDALTVLGRILAGQSSVHTAFQRIARLDSGLTSGYEALARVPQLRDPQCGVEDVFALAQRRGATRHLDWICRRTAIAAAASLPPDADLFINVSAAMLLDPLHPVDHMLLLSDWGRRAPQTIVLEITEREAIADKRRLRYVLASYREHGFRFALDDVGEGNSTLEILAVAVPEYVKIARSLTTACSEGGARAVIEAAAAFARSCGSDVIAEGIEDEATADTLVRLGVMMGQGYWLGRPELQLRSHSDVEERATA